MTVRVRDVKDPGLFDAQGFQARFAGEDELEAVRHEQERNHEAPRYNGRCLRLTKYTSPGWRMAADITASLRALNPDDPVRFDFSLCHVGMMNACGFSRAQADSQCPLRGLCRPRVRTPRRSRTPSVRR